MRQEPIATAKRDTPILATDGKWTAVVYWDGFSKWHIHHFATCQEYDWEPTHWFPDFIMPSNKQGV